MAGGLGHPLHPVPHEAQARAAELPAHGGGQGIGARPSQRRRRLQLIEEDRVVRAQRLEHEAELLHPAQRAGLHPGPRPGDQRHIALLQQVQHQVVLEPGCGDDAQRIHTLFVEIPSGGHRREGNPSPRGQKARPPGGADRRRPGPCRPVPAAPGPRWPPPPGGSPPRPPPGGQSCASIPSFSERCVIPICGLRRPSPPSSRRRSAGEVCRELRKAAAGRAWPQRRDGQKAPRS